MIFQLEHRTSLKMKESNTDKSELKVPMRKDLIKKGPLTNSEAHARLTDMIQQIEVVTNEKLEHIAAEEVEAIEKFKTEVHIAKQDIEKEYMKKEIIVGRNKKINNSKISQGARIKILIACDELIKEITLEVKKRVKEDVKDNFIRYMEPLLMQAAFRLIETKLYIKIRQPDENNVLSVLRSIEKKIYKEIKLKVHMQIHDSYLAQNDVGRIIVYNTKMNIFVDSNMIKKVEIVAKRVFDSLFAFVLNKSKGRHQENYDLQLNPLCVISLYITPDTIRKEIERGNAALF